MVPQLIKILVVEGNPDAGHVDERLREVKGIRFEIVHEERLAGAMHRVATQPFDVVLLDLELSDSHGLDTFRRMQQACAEVPIVVSTNQDNEEAGLETVREGAQDYLTKNEITPNVLFRSIRYAIERKHVTAARHASEIEYRRLFESARDGILILDAATGQINDANQFLVDLLGYSKEEFLEKKLWEIGLFQDIDGCKKGFAKLQQEGHVRYEDLPIVTKDGRSVDVEFVSNSYFVADHQQRIQCNIRDISERVRAEAALARERRRVADKLLHLNTELEQQVQRRTDQLEAANQELEAFAYSVSHDLRAPLRAIDGFSRILLNEHLKTLPEKAQHYLQMVYDNARQMGRLIDDILRLSRLSRQSLLAQTVVPASLVRQCLEELQPEREGRRVEFQIGELPECWADAGLLKQVWFNLLGNALKYTRKRDCARIEIGSYIAPSPLGAEGGVRGDGEMVYFIRDNGVGFDMHYAGKLFGVFQRLHSAEEFEGTGIGLALAQRILHRHGGRIWADAKVDHGATFYFTLGRRSANA